ncbi:hypothetical protein P8452_42252 [Trifolium repens]|nr:hypothetical protein P8452_42252 [Trifolium repens]
MVDPYFDSLKNADAAEPRFKAWNELDPAGAPIAQHESIMSALKALNITFNYIQFEIATKQRNLELTIKRLLQSRVLMKKFQNGEESQKATSTAKLGGGDDVEMVV